MNEETTAIAIVPGRQSRAAL